MMRPLLLVWLSISVIDGAIVALDENERPSFNPPQGLFDSRTRFSGR
jgi:hypothetical protein